jgi:hypothetical protein
MRRTIILVVLLWVSDGATAQEVSIFYGKGIGADGVAEANPNEDFFAIALHHQFQPHMAWHMYMGQCNGGVVKSSTGGNALSSRPFVSGGMGLEYRNQYYDTHFHAGIGASLVSRTNDGAQYAVAPHLYASLAYEFRHAQFGMAVFEIVRPNLTDTGGHGGRWDSPLFSGLFFSFNMKTER